MSDTDTPDLWDTDPAAAVHRGDCSALTAFYKGTISGAECGSTRRFLRRRYEDRTGGTYPERPTSDLPSLATVHADPR